MWVKNDEVFSQTVWAESQVIKIADKLKSQYGYDEQSAKRQAYEIFSCEHPLLSHLEWTSCLKNYKSKIKCKDKEKYWKQRAYRLKQRMFRQSQRCKKERYLRNTLSDIIYGELGDSEAEELLSCNCRFFYDYIKKKFKKGMNWNNWGRVWQLDHIKPVAAFDLLSYKQQKECFHYSNFQPLFIDENIKKSSWYNGKWYKKL